MWYGFCLYLNYSRSQYKSHSVMYDLYTADIIALSYFHFRRPHLNHACRHYQKTAIPQPIKG